MPFHQTLTTVRKCPLQTLQITDNIPVVGINSTPYKRAERHSAPRKASAHYQSAREAHCRILYDPEQVEEHDIDSDVSEDDLSDDEDMY